MQTNLEQAVHAPQASTEARGLTVPAWSFVLVFLIGGTLLHIWLHHRAHGIVNVHQVALAAFLILNLLVNFWEIGLLACGDRIAEEYAETKDVYRGRELERVSSIFTRRIPIMQLLSFRQWTGIWSGYALFDPGYAQRHSFGFNIDSFNGLSTIIPATTFAYCMTFQFMPARWLGIIGVAMFWQMFYGTIVYFFQFFHSGRHKGHSLGSLFVFVGTTNIMWFIFPLWGMAVSVWLILGDSYSIFM